MASAQSYQGGGPAAFFEFRRQHEKDEREEKRREKIKIAVLDEDDAGEKLEIQELVQHEQRDDHRDGDERRAYRAGHRPPGELLDHLLGRRLADMPQRLRGRTSRRRILEVSGPALVMRHRIAVARPGSSLMRRT